MNKWKVRAGNGSTLGHFYVYGPCSFMHFTNWHEAMNFADKLSHQTDYRRTLRLITRIREIIDGEQEDIKALERLETQTANIVISHKRMLVESLSKAISHHPLELAQDTSKHSAAEIT